MITQLGILSLTCEDLVLDLDLETSNLDLDLDLDLWRSWSWSRSLKSWSCFWSWDLESWSWSWTFLSCYKIGIYKTKPLPWTNFGRGLRGLPRSKPKTEKGSGSSFFSEVQRIMQSSVSKSRKTYKLKSQKIRCRTDLDIGRDGCTLQNSTQKKHHKNKHRLSRRQTEKSQQRLI